MDENTNVTMETADQQDAFLLGWDAEAGQDAQARSGEETAASETAAEPTGTDAAEEAGDGETGAAEGADQSAEPAADGADAGAPEPPDPDAEQPQANSWDVKHMGKAMTLHAQDITPELLQKGLDYDRVRTAYDEAKPVVEILRKYAKNADMSLGDYARMIRAKALEGGGMSEADAKRTVELEDREAAVAAKELQQQQETESAQQAQEALRADLQQFARAFPDVYKQAEQDPKTIPAEVWDAVNGGLSLTAAYARYAVAQAQQQAKAAQLGAHATAQNAKNAERSTGSMRSAMPQQQVSDPFLLGWGE